MIVVSTRTPAIRHSPGTATGPRCFEKAAKDHNDYMNMHRGSLSGVTREEKSVWGGILLRSDTTRCPRRVS